MNDPHKCSLSSGQTQKRTFWENYFLPNINVAKYKKLYISELQCKIAIANYRSSHSYMIYPITYFRIYYEMWMCFIFILSFFLCPFIATLASYCPNDLDHPLMIELLILDSFLKANCTIDIIMTFFTGYINERSRMIMSFKRVARFFNVPTNQYYRRYLFSFMFVFDVVSSIPCLTYSTNNTIIRIYILLLANLKVFKLNTCMGYLNQTTEYFQSKTLYVFSIFLYYLIIYHWLVTAHFLTPQIKNIITQDFECTKFDRDEFFGHLAEKYYNCISMSFVAKNYDDSFEFILNTALIVAGKMVLFYITIEIAVRMLRQRRLEIKYFSQLEEIDCYTMRKRLPLTLRKTINEYYKYKYNRKFYQESDINQLLTEPLRRAVAMHTSANIIKSVKLLSQLPTNITEELLLHLKPQIYMPNDIVIKAGAVGDFMCFLSSGTVAVCTPSGKEVCHLHDGAYFGEIALLTKNVRTAHVTAIEICQIYTLSKKAFKKCFKQYPEVMEILENTAIERMKITAEKEYLHTHSHHDMTIETDYTQRPTYKFE